MPYAGGYRGSPVWQPVETGFGEALFRRHVHTAGRDVSTALEMTWTRIQESSIRFCIGRAVGVTSVSSVPTTYETLNRIEQGWPGEPAEKANK